MKANCDWIEDLENGSEDDDAVKLVESRVEVVWSERVHADHLGVFVIVFVIVIEFVFVIVFVIVIEFVSVIVFAICDLGLPSQRWKKTGRSALHKLKKYLWKYESGS